jgi:hypothetical protein
MRKQLTLFDNQSVSDADRASLTKSVSEGKRQAIHRYLTGTAKETEACVNSYSPGGSNRRYYRLSYRIDTKVKHLHIPGGNTNSRLATYRADSLRDLIERGADLQEIIAMVYDFRD